MKKIDFISSEITVSHKSKPLFWLMLILLCALPMAINLFCVYTPILAMSADVALAAWVEVLSYASDFLNLIAFTAPFALLIFSKRFLCGARSALVIAFYVTVIVLNVPLKLLMYAPVFGTLGSSAEIAFNLINLLLECIGSAVQLLLVLFIAAPARNEKKEELIPFKSLLSLKNPLQKSAFITAVIVFSMKAVSKALSVLFSIVQYGAEDFFADLGWQLLYLSVDVITYAVYGAVCYFLILVIFIFLNGRLGGFDTFCEKKKTGKSQGKKKKDAEANSSASALDI